MTFDKVTVTGNSVQGATGIDGGARGQDGGTAQGGGVFLAAGSLTIMNSTISRIPPAGGKGGDGRKGGNSTVSADLLGFSRGCPHFTTTLTVAGSLGYYRNRSRIGHNSNSRDRNVQDDFFQPVLHTSASSLVPRVRALRRPRTACQGEFRDIPTIFLIVGISQCAYYSRKASERSAMGLAGR